MKARTDPSPRELRLMAIALAFVFALALVFAPSGAIPAEEAIEEQARQQLKRMCSALGGAKTLEFKAYALLDDFEPSGVKFKRGLVQEVTIQRPDRLHFRTAEDDGDVREGWYDGKTFTIAQPENKLYAQIEATGGLDGLLDLLQDEYSANIPIVDLLYADPYGRLEEHLLSGAHLGEKHLEGIALDHLSFETTPADIQFWVEKKGAPVPRRLVLDFVAVEGDPEYLVTFRDWALDGSVNSSAFEFSAPKDWKKVELEKRK